MKRFFTLVIFIFIACSLHAQEEVFKTIKNYYRVNPFEGSFSGFVRAFSSDPELLDKKTTHLTDSSLFAVRGRYENFNPFSIKTDSVVASLIQREILFSDSNEKDTLTFYQISGHFKNTDVNLKYIEKEYKKLTKKLRPGFASAAETNLVNVVKEISKGKITNYFTVIPNISPASVSWYHDNTNNELVMLMVLRLTYSGNKAVFAGYL